MNGNLNYLAINGFITFDFETMEEIINEKTSDSTTLMSVLHPLSVAMSVSTDDIKTYYFDLRDGENFVELFVQQLFKSAADVKEYNLNRHRPLIESLGYIENKTTNAR